MNLFLFCCFLFSLSWRLMINIFSVFIPKAVPSRLPFVFSYGHGHLVLLLALPALFFALMLVPWSLLSISLTSPWPLLPSCPVWTKCMSCSMHPAFATLQPHVPVTFRVWGMSAGRPLAFLTVFSPSTPRIVLSSMPLNVASSARFL